ncbi:MAG TPA: DUF6603 domain-containing protein [Chloroflexota bacterium]|nr:DUF6603 domain-containing protein [Chloroflexota bacterium]
MAGDTVDKPDGTGEASETEQDDKTLLQRIAREVVDFGRWVVRTFFLDPHSRALNALVDDLGGTLKSTPQLPTDLGLDQLKTYIEAPRPGLEAWIGAIGDVRKLYESVRAVAEAIDLGPEATTEEVAQSLLDLMASNYVRDRWFQLYLWMEFARFSTEPATLYGPQGTAGRRFYGSLKALLKFALAPFSTLAGPPMQTEADARKWSDSTLLHLAGILAFVDPFLDPLSHRAAREIGLDPPSQDEDEALLRVFYGWDQPPGALSDAQLAAPAADDLSERMLSVQVQALAETFAAQGIQVQGALRFTLAWVPAEQGGKGLFVSLGGSTFRFGLDTGGAWAAQAEARFDAPFSVQLGGAEERFRTGGVIGDGEAHADLSIASRPVPAGEHRFRLSLGGDNGLQIGRIALSGTLGNEGAKAQLSFYDCRLALDGSSFDDFIGSLLPRTQTSVEFSFGTGVSTTDGLFTTAALATPTGAPAGTDSGSRDADGAPDGAPAVVPPDLPVASSGLQGGGIPLQIPVGKSIGAVRLNHVLLNLDRETEGDSPKALVQAALSFDAQIGPVLASVARIGLKLALDFPEDQSQANLHFANLDVGFLAPAGIGLAVDARSVKGGGFLFYDAAQQQYAGVLELSLSGVIALKAIGLLSTRLPDGSRGYSLLILVTAQSAQPGGSLLELPMGWRLTGLGGLIAIHRTVDEDAVRAGLKNHTLESILFPNDPVKNAPTIIAALGRVFPPRKGSYLLGFMVQLQWGMPTLIEVNLGLIVELGGRNRFVVLGRLTSILPRMDNDLLRLSLDAVGIVDFDQGTVAIDALLVDSRLLRRFPLTGGAALRARWTSPRSFALAAGGMHHGFTPPAGFPPLDRLALSLTTGDNPRLTCEAYYALTSNTVQWGAHLDFYAAAFGFNVQGEAGYDVLIQLSPFHFLAEFYAGMQLRKGSRNLFKVKVEGALEGPLPLAVRAKCTFEILWWDVSIRVNVTLVGGQAPPLPAAVDAFAQLRAALADTRSWSAELPPAQTGIVTLREAPADGVLRAHPLGTLTVRQGVVPLNLDRDIDKLGDAPVAGARRFTVTRVGIGSGGGSAEPGSAVLDDFAPAQFFEMSDEARLASPSFESMPAGMRIGSPELAFGFAQRAESALEYETRVVDRKAATPPPPPQVDYRLSVVLLQLHARHGAAGRSPLRRERMATARPFARIEPVRWTAVGDDLAPLPDGKRDVTFAEALGDARRGLRPQGLVVRDFELTQSGGQA